MARLSSFLIMVALIAGMVGCGEVAPPTRYNLTMAVAPAGSGNATDLTNTSPYAAGTVVNITAVAGVGYQFVKWTAPGGTFGNATAVQTTFTMPAQNVTVTANFGVKAMEIRTWYDLDAIRDNMDGTYLLMNDLDSTTAGYEELASPTANGGKGWKPIGSLSVDPVRFDIVNPIDAFTGSLDGQGYEIRDLCINRPDEDGVGLFGCAGGGEVVENLGVVNAEVTGRSYVGGLVGWQHYGTVSNSYSTGSVIGDEQIGGLVGGSWGVVSNSYLTGSVIGNEHVGGLLGGNWGSVSSCYSTGNVTGGGGLNKGGVGGLVGGNWGGVSRCYSTGNVTGGLEVGGLVGWQHYGTVSKSYSTGSVTGSTRVGGLVGANYYDGRVTHCYSTSRVTGDDHVGGLTGENYATVINSFWDVETSGTEESDGGTGRTTAQMKNVTTFSAADWSIIAVADPGTRNTDYTWNIVDGQTYPFLSWEPVS